MGEVHVVAAEWTLNPTGHANDRRAVRVVANRSRHRERDEGFSLNLVSPTSAFADPVNATSRTAQTDSRIMRCLWSG